VKVKPAHLGKVNVLHFNSVSTKMIAIVCKEEEVCKDKFRIGEFLRIGSSFCISRLESLARGSRLKVTQQRLKVA
jgi:hypothetical protein